MADAKEPEDNVAPDAQATPAGGTKNDDGWQVVGGKKQQQQQSKPVRVSQEQRDLWRAKWEADMTVEEKARYDRGECIACGSTGHKKARCPSRTDSRKRARETGTGITPESKKPNTGGDGGESEKKSEPKFSYARANSKFGIVVSKADGSEVTEEEEENLTAKYNEDIVTMLLDGKTWTPESDKWWRRTGRLWIDIPDEKSETWLKESIAASGTYKVLKREEFFTQKRTVLTGYLKGATAKLPKDKLSLLLKVGLKSAKVGGRRR